MLLSPSSFDALDRSCQEVTLGLHVATQRVNRLLATAFVNPVRADAGLKACLKGVGVAGTLDILDDKSLLPRSHYFGLLRGTLSFRGERVRAQQALTELPEAIRDREMLGHKLDDLMNARRALLEQVAGRNFHVPDPSRGNGGGRRRTR